MLKKQKHHERLTTVYLHAILEVIKCLPGRGEAYEAGEFI